MMMNQYQCNVTILEIVSTLIIANTSPNYMNINKTSSPVLLCHGQYSKNVKVCVILMYILLSTV